MTFPMRALWTQGYLIIDGRVWQMDVSIDTASEILAELQDQFPKQAPSTLYTEPIGWF